MTPESLFFLRPEEPIHKRYEALRSFYVEGMTAREVSAKFGYTVSTVYAKRERFQDTSRLGTTELLVLHPTATGTETEGSQWEYRPTHC